MGTTVATLVLGGAACGGGDDAAPRPIDPSGTGSGGAGIDDGGESPATTSGMTGQKRGDVSPTGS